MPNPTFYTLIKSSTCPLILNPTFILILLFFFFSCGEMKKYLDEAEEDKKRYIEELKIYQQSEQYQAFMKRQSAKKVKTIVGKILQY